jgi:lipopolysaccharide export system permease protein
MALGFALNVWIVPAASGAFREFQFEIRNRVVAFLLQEGVFTQVSEHLTVFVRSRDPDGGLRGILVDDGRNRESHATILAESGRLVADQGPPRVLLANGSREELDHRSGRLNVLTFAENTVELSDTDKGDEQRFRDPTEMSIAELLHPETSGVPERDWGKLRMEAHRRLSSPLTSLSFTLIALTATLTGTFRRHGSLLRPFLAVVVVVALEASGLAIGNLAARAPVLLPLLWLHASLPGAAAAWILLVPQFVRGGLGARQMAG